MPEALVRRMTLADVDAVCAIEDATFARPWSRDSFVHEMTDNVCARYMVLEQDGVILGYAGAWIVLDEGHITNIAVRKDARGQGLGRKLTGALIQYAANLGVQYMTLEVRKSNLIAQSLYQSLGFVKVAIRKKYYENNGEDALFLVLAELPSAEPDFQEQ